MEVRGHCRLSLVSYTCPVLDAEQCTYIVETHIFLVRQPASHLGGVEMLAQLARRDLLDELFSSIGDESAHVIG